MTNQWISGVLGLIVAIAPFLPLSDTAFTWTLVTVGLVIMISSLWGMMASESSEHHTHGMKSHV